MAHMLYNPLPAVRLPIGGASGDRGVLGGAIGNWGDHVAGLAGFFLALPIQRGVKAILSAFGLQNSRIAELISTGLTILGGFLVSRGLADDKAAAVFQFGVVSGAAAPLLSGGLEWLKQRIPALAGSYGPGWDTPGQVDTMPAFNQDQIMAMRNAPAYAEVDKMNADYEGESPDVPSQYAVFQGDDHAYAPPQ